MNQIAQRALASDSQSFKKRNPDLFKPGTVPIGSAFRCDHCGTLCTGNNGENLGACPKCKCTVYATYVGTNPNRDKPAKRIRQSSKPVLNKLEQEWVNFVSGTEDDGDSPIRAQSKRYQIGNGAWYKPDFTCSKAYCISKGEYIETAWEVKGGKGMKGQDRQLLALKAAAHCWPEVRFILVWKDEQGQWVEQIVLP